MNEPLTLTERALKFKYDTQRALAQPQARMIPETVRQLLNEQAVLIAEIAKAINQGGNDGK